MDAPLGWTVLPAKKGMWAIPPIELPRLSRAEAMLTAQIRDTYFAAPTPPPNPGEFSPIIRTYAQQAAIQLQSAQEKDMVHTLTLLTQGAGPLTPLLNTPLIEEVAITGMGMAHPVRVYHSRLGWMDTPLVFTQADTLVSLLNRLTRESGKRLTSATPILNAMLPDGSRLHASMHPVCANGVEVSIRKFIARATRIDDLKRLHVASPEALAFLSAAIRTDASLLVIGNTGSGKTTTLNALLGSLPPHERLVVAEETPELQFTHPHVVRMLPAPESNLPLARIIRETLRMRPDRVIIGEIRFPDEAHSFMECVLAGQGKGTYATFHGHSAEEALARLRQFGIPDSDLGWINVLVVQRRWSEHGHAEKAREVRAITQIVELESKNGLIHVNPLFEWDDARRKLVKRNESRVIRAQWTRSFPGKKWAGGE